MTPNNSITNLNLNLFHFYFPKIKQFYYQNPPIKFKVNLF
jgi:hypothetical protein